MEVAALLAVFGPIASAAIVVYLRKRTALDAAREIFRDRRCCVCDAPISTPRLAAHPPALRRPDGVTNEWTRLSIEELRDAATTHLPVCWNCHLAAEFQRRYPDLVTDRPAR